MLVLKYAKERVLSFQNEISRLRESDFPHPHSREALDLIGKLIETRRVALENVSPTNTSSVIRNACAEAFTQIYANHVRLGFILRFTNIRNSFEVYKPILYLCRLILGNDTKLILSSEWEYSPFVYNPIADLPNFVLMGLPASESGNPLLTPLAGHELGHTTWQKKKIAMKYASKVNENMYKFIYDNWNAYDDMIPCARENLRTDMFAYRKLAPYFYFVSKQAEESFCDFMGIKIFAESYLHAFAYLVAPGSAKMRQDKYPKMQVRVANMITAATNYGLIPPEHYVDNFSNELDSSNFEHMQLMNVVDHAAGTITAELIQEASAVVEAAGVPSRNQSRIEDAIRSYRLLVPASGSGSLANILNAGWSVYNDADLWNEHLELQQDRNKILYDIILKSIEVLEYESITSSITGG